MFLFERTYIQEALSGGNSPVQQLFKCGCAEAGIVPELPCISDFFDFLPADSSGSGDIYNFYTCFNKAEGSGRRDAASNLFYNNRDRDFCRKG